MKEKISPWIIVLALFAAFVTGKASNEHAEVDATLRDMPRFLSASCIQ